MDERLELLRERSQEIAENAADIMGRDEFSEPLHRIVLDLADNFASDAPLDTAALKSIGADEAEIARALRFIEAESVDALQTTTDTATLTQRVLGVRSRIVQSLPKQLVDDESYAFYGRLRTEPSESDETELSQMIAIFQGMVGTIRNLVYIHDLRGNLLYINDRGLEMTKYTLDDFHKGISIYSIIVPEYLDLVEDRLISRDADKFAPYTIEIFTKDGNRIPVHVTTRSIEMQGRIVAIAGIARDLRLERWMESELRRSTETLDLLMNSVPTGVVIVSSHGLVERANEAALEILGIENLQSLEGQPLFGDDKEALLGPQPGSDNQWQPWSGTTTLGAAITCECLAAALPADSDGKAGKIVILRK